METNTIPSQATFTLVLTKVLTGTSPVMANANCTFTYNWNFGTNTGSAQLDSINNCTLNTPLYAEGNEGMLDFMSDLETPLHTVINGQRVVIKRIILDIDISTNSRAAAIVFNEDGSCIETTDNWNYGTAFFTK